MEHGHVDTPKAPTASTRLSHRATPRFDRMPGLVHHQEHRPPGPGVDALARERAVEPRCGAGHQTTESRRVVEREGRGRRAARTDRGPASSVRRNSRGRSPLPTDGARVRHRARLQQLMSPVRSDPAASIVGVNRASTTAALSGIFVREVAAARARPAQRVHAARRLRPRTGARKRRKSSICRRAVLPGRLLLRCRARRRGG